MMKKFLSLLLVVAMLGALLIGCTGPEESKAEERLPNFMVMSGPTGVGAAKLLADQDAAAEGSKVLASGTVVADNTAVTSALINGEADIAAIATNITTIITTQEAPTWEPW